MKLDIIIVNYNVKYYLEQCLYAVREAVVGVDSQIWVVDNNSKDGSVEYLQPLFPEVNFIQSKENGGFSKANNLAIRQSHGEYVLLLNPDTIVSSKTIKECIHLLDEHPEIGCTGVSMYNADGTYARESKRSVPTAKVSFYKMCGLSTLFPKHREFAKYHMGFLDPNESNEIEILSGAYCMMRRKALDEVGLLDETFFMYGEDIDLSYRFIKNGWKNWYLPTPMIHYKGESAHPSTIRYVNVFYQAMIIFYDKHFGGRFSLSAWLIRFAVYFKALITLFVHFFRYCKSLIVPSPKFVYAYLLCDKDSTAFITSKLKEHDILVCDEKEKAEVMIFQKSAYSYDEMIFSLIGQESRKRLSLGVYEDERGIIILPREVIA